MKASSESGLCPTRMVRRTAVVIGESGPRSIDGRSVVPDRVRVGPPSRGYVRHFRHRGPRGLRDASGAGLDGPPRVRIDLVADSAQRGLAGVPDLLVVSSISRA